MIALHEMLSADADIGAAVCRDGAEVLTLGDLRACADVVAQAVETHGARRVAICTDDPYAFACALFGVAAARAEVVIPGSHAPGYLDDLAHAYDLMLDASTLATCMRDAEPAAAAIARTIEAAAPVTLYTSGSSGTAKPVRKSLAQLDAEVRTLQREWADSVGTAVTLSSVPHHHIYGLLFRILWPLAAGRAFDRISVLEPLQLQQRLAAYGGGIVVSTPSQLMRWPSLPGFPMQAPAPCAFFSSGGPLPADAATAYSKAFGAAPLEIFGSTETGGIAWRRQDGSAAWQPLTGVDVRCDDDGALCVRSAHLGHDRWHRTDDTARFDAQGRFVLAGRRDRVVKLDGKRVSLPELEARLLTHAYIEQAAAVVIDGATRSSRTDGWPLRRPCATRSAPISTRRRCRVTGDSCMRCRSMRAANCRLPHSRQRSGPRPRASSCSRPGKPTTRCITNCACRPRSRISKDTFRGCRSCRASCKSTGRRALRLARCPACAKCAPSST
ncbi:Benzoate--CoA ligase [Burkholderia multivorans]|nr:AMP-binding enzyme domain protein [Burkholderia multivorans CF2]MDR8875269.1 Benzoate--CoA ligase [Burkholderia multivorans]MDR8882096.1 Benzoate--CoA ligase [Burkholderia multivorans]MDR8888929.1 Benzoate--CoA ligase [Burkholderia multivorans]MDR8893682.1 Benzoate--CoA ligase [Burkholderia multivorans]